MLRRGRRARALAVPAGPRREQAAAAVGDAPAVAAMLDAHGADADLAEGVGVVAHGRRVAVVAGGVVVGVEEPGRGQREEGEGEGKEGGGKEDEEKGGGEVVEE